jgi:MYXO-CTERM domain-containing protein
MRHGWIGVLALAVVPAAGALAAVQYQATVLPVPAGSMGVSPSVINQEHDIGLNAAFPIPDAAPGAASSYTLPYLLSNGTLTALPIGNGNVSGSILGLNDAGNAVGFVTDASGENFPALWAGGALILLDHGTMAEGEAFAINNLGQIAGAITTHSAPNFTSDAALWNGTALTDLGEFGGTQAFAKGINNNGQVLVLADGAPSGVVIHDAISDRTVGAPAVGATAINDAGQVLVGDDDNVNYIWQSGTFKALPATTGNRFDVPWAMNNLGDAVGYTLTTDGTMKAILWQSGQVFDLNSLVGNGWNLTVATGIADNGSIIAIGSYQGQQEAVLLTPTASPSGSSSAPEPASIATLGVAGLLLLRRRRWSV